MRWDAVHEDCDLVGLLVAPLDLKADPVVGPRIRLPGNKNVFVVGVSFDGDHSK